MIDCNIVVEYLNPETWTNLGIVFSHLKPKKQILHVLKTTSNRMKGVTSDHKLIALDDFISSELLDIQGIFTKNKEIEEIRVYTRKGLIDYYKKVQDSSIYKMDIDDYLIYLYQMQEQVEGIQIFTRTNKKRCYLEYMQRLINRNISDGAFMLWLTNGQELFFNCIMEFRLGKLVRLSTSDRYHEVCKDYDQVCNLLKKEFHNSANYVTMDVKEFQVKTANLI